MWEGVAYCDVDIRRGGIAKICIEGVYYDVKITHVRRSIERAFIHYTDDDRNLVHKTIWPVIGNIVIM